LFVIMAFGLVVLVVLIVPEFCVNKNLNKLRSDPAFIFIATNRNIHTMGIKECLHRLLLSLDAL